MAAFQDPRECAKYQRPGNDSPTCNDMIIKFQMINFFSFPIVASQNVCCDKSLLCENYDACRNKFE